MDKLNRLCPPPPKFFVCMCFDRLSIWQDYHSIMFDRENRKVIRSFLQEDCLTFFVYLWWWGMSHTDRPTVCSTASGLCPCPINSVSRDSICEYIYYCGFCALEYGPDGRTLPLWLGVSENGDFCFRGYTWRAGRVLSRPASGSVFLTPRSSRSLEF